MSVFLLLLLVVRVIQFILIYKIKKIDRKKERGSVFICVFVCVCVPIEMFCTREINQLVAKIVFTAKAS